jgi:hypothetical protein
MTTKQKDTQTLIYILFGGLLFLLVITLSQVGAGLQAYQDIYNQNQTGEIIIITISAHTANTTWLVTQNGTQNVTIPLTQKTTTVIN